MILIISRCHAFSFSAVCSTGQTLYYNITSDSTVELTYPGNLGIRDIYVRNYYGGWDYTTSSPYSYYSGSGIYYSLSNTFTRPIGNMVLPQQVQYNGTTYRVTSIGPYAFYNCYDIQALVIPNSVTTIGHSAFSGCTSIDSLCLGNGITTISNQAFQNCTSIHKLIIPDNVTSIGQFAFRYCSGIDSLYIGSGAVTIEDRAFGGCTGLSYMYYNARNLGVSLFMESPYYGIPGHYGGNSPFCETITPYFSTLIIGDSVRSIPVGCFYNRPIDSLVIPDSVTSIGEYAFYNCSHIDSLYIGNGIITIPNYVFTGCSSLQNLFIPNTVTSIGDSAFSGCSSIHNLIIPNNVTSIGEYAFSGCSGIHNLVIPDNVTSIGEYAFSGCSSIESLYMSSGITSIPDYAFSECSSVRNLVIPNNITSIGAYSFFGCSSIDSLYIGSGVTSIGSNAFRGCTGLHYMYYNASNLNTSHFMNANNSTSPFYNTSNPNFTTLVFGDSVSSIPVYCFCGQTGLDSIMVIPDNVTNMGQSAFSGCAGIDSLYISHGITSIPNHAFSGCSNIHHLVIFDNVTSIGQYAFSSCSGIDYLHLGRGLTSIPNHAFDNCSSIRNLVIPDNVSIIGEYSFYGCFSIDSIYIGSGVDSIGYGAFQNCTGLSYMYYNARNLGTSHFMNANRGSSPFYNTSTPNFTTLMFGDSVRSIPVGCFYNRTTIEGTLLIQNSVSYIGQDAFYNCDNILSINTNARYIGNSAFANCDRLVSVSLGDSVQTLGSGAFSGCFRLNNVSLGESIISIGDRAFSGCIRLTKPEMPNSIATIGARAFDGCGDINGKLTFPASITHIGDSAYNGVGNITEIEMKGSTPPTIHAHTFAAVDSLVTVSVPCGAVLNYYITDYWENFPNIVEAPPYRLTVQSNNEVMGFATVTQQTTCSNHTATIYAVAQTGYHFLQWNDGITANPRSIPMTQDSTFTAIFVVNNSYITVHANDSTMGSVSGTGLYGYNAPVTLTATAYSGYHFLRWSDGNTQNPRYLAAVRDSSFTAIFVSNVSTITVANANPDMGNVSGSGVYYYQNLVSITATANYGYHFVQWNDGNTQNPRTIIVSQDSAFTAFFALNTYSIVATSNSTTMGSVSGGGQYTYLHEMSMTATPAYGYHFVQWNDGVTDNPRTITVTRDSAFTAQFAANSYTLTVAPNDATMGSAYGAGSYNYNTTATLTAVPNYGYHFTQWSDAVTDNPRTVTVLNNATYTAQFEINSYIITVQSSNPAIGTTSGSGSYNYLTPVNITALPNAGYHFTQWSDGNMTNPRLISVTANATYTAQFAINSYAVGVTSNNSTMGSVSGSGTYNHNSTATLTATPYYGYHFVQWQDGNTQNPRTVVVTDSAQYTAQFDYNSYLVTALSSNVTLGTATGGGSYNYLSQVALTAVPAPHYHFTMWNDSIEDNPRTITVTRDTTLTAHFAIDRHTIGVNTANATQGTASGSSTVDYNTAVWISATPNYGYHFTQWNDGNSSNPRRVVVSQDTVFTANFAPNQYTATCMANDNTRGSVTSAGGSYNYLTSVTFTAVPNANYHFLRWSNGSNDNPITFTLTQDTALTAIFVGLTANVDDNTMGTATHTKTANLVEVVTATPNYGYHFVQWQDGNTDNPRTVTLTQDTVLTAYFAVNTYYLTLVSNDTTMGTVSGSGSYNYLTQVTLTAAANDHHHFVQWNDGNTTNPRLITLTSDTTFIAQFEEDARYSITVSSNDTTMGTVAGSGSYYGGEQVVLTASPREHYHFVGWGDGNTQNPRTITVVGDADYTAVFEADIYTITVTANDPTMGSVMGGGEYGYGTEVTIAAQPFAGYGFRGWSDGDTNRERTIVVTEDASYQAIFYDMVGISDVEMPDYSVNVEQNNIHIGGVSQRKIAVYDISGRRIAYIDKSPETYIVTVPATGVYLIQVEGMRARKVVVY